ncbi:MAG: hypothetical protein WBM41_09185 [Arenicellales bacterium]
MHRLKTVNSIPLDDDYMHLVRLPEDCCIPSWLVHAQIELDGKRVFVRMIDTTIRSNSRSENTIIGLVVSPVY